jgi:hypothetical protein
MNIVNIGNRTKRRKNVKLYEITIPAQTVRIEATSSHVAVSHMWEQMGGYEIREIVEGMRCPHLSKKGHCMFNSRKHNCDCPLLQLDEIEWNGECANLSEDKYILLLRYR